MNLHRRHLVGAGALAAFGQLTARAAWADAPYPSKLLTFVVPFGAGGPPDAYVRLFAQKLEKRIGQHIVVDNRPGANSVVGTTLVARSRPDGYTVLYGTNSSLSAAPFLFKSVSYDPGRDFNGVMITGEGYFALVVGARDKGITMRELLERIRKSPESYPIGGSSTTAEVLNKQMQTNAKLSHTYVRYAASAKMMTDLIGGRLGAAFQPVVGLAPFLQAETLHMVGIASPRRVPSYPNTPTVSEVVPGVDVGYWNGFFVPAGTPAPVVEFLHRHMKEVVEDPEVVRMVEQGGVVLRMGPSETDEFVKKDIQRWRELIHRAGIEPS